VPDLSVVQPQRRAISIFLAAAVLAVGVAAVLLVLIGPLRSSNAAGQPCSSYPTPGAPAPAGTKVPASLASEYALLREPQRPADRLSPKQVAGLKASGLIMSGTRFLGDAAFGGRIYLVPAEHLLSLPLAPARCLSSLQRLIEQESSSVLQSQYREAAVCIDVLYANGRTQECGPAAGTPYPLLSVTGTPAFGLVPDGVSAVTVTYPVSPPTTVAVQRNSFVVVAPSESAPACGLQWLDPTGNVKRVVTGCSYLTPQIHELDEYRAYVAGKLSALRSQVTALSGAVRSGNLAAARADWLAAHLTWLDIGQDDGAYGCFGALGGEIDGLAAGHPLGTSDPGFTGFHRVEFDLWTKRDLDAAASDTAVLENLLARLVKAPLSSYLPATATGIGNWLLRPHEVLEDALRDSLTAEDDYGSGTDLASLTADVAAVRVMLGELRPGLDLFSPHLLSTANSELDALSGAIDATRVGGAWVSVQDVPIRQRQQVDADLDAALETLAPIPDLLTSTGTNAPGD
jgi:iron uptake system EfeUOB component EfeO/EfeM